MPPRAFVKNESATSEAERNVPRFLNGKLGTAHFSSRGSKNCRLLDCLPFPPAFSFTSFVFDLSCLLYSFSSHLAANHVGAMVAKLMPK